MKTIYTVYALRFTVIKLDPLDICVQFHLKFSIPYDFSLASLYKVERKRHIGNDIAVIVFCDGEPDEELHFTPSSVRTKFTHVFAVIRYSKRTRSHYLTVFSEENVPAYGPPVPVPARFANPQEFRSFLITKCKQFPRYYIV